MGRELSANTWLKTLSLIGCLGLLVMSGCPGTSTAVNWPSERLDNNPSTQPVAVEIADMDTDGLKDVVSAWRGSSSRPGAVAIHFQNASGEWTTTTVHASTNYANVNELTVKDMNADGHADIVVAVQDRITYLRAPADARTASGWKAINLSTSIGDQYKGWFAVGAAQIDGVNGLDIVATLNGTGRLVWFAAPADPESGEWTLRSIDSTTRQGADSLALIDLSGDNKPDVVCSATGDTSGEVSWYEQPANPATDNWPKHIMTSMDGSTRLAMGDLNGDGLVDLAAISGSSRRVAWFPQPADLTTAWNGWVLADYKKASTDQREPIDVAIADMDNNGQLDVVVVTAGPTGLFWYSPQSDISLPWVEHRIAAYTGLDFALFDVSDTDGDALPEVIVPITQASDHTLDRIERFINPVAVPAE